MRKALFILLFFTCAFFASTIVVSSQADFDQGTYVNASFNTTSGAVELDLENTTGTYTSKIFDAGSTQEWLWLNWTDNYGTLPNNNSIESNANMTDNLVLLHINESPGSTNFTDYSGNNHTFSCTSGNCPSISLGGILDGTIIDFDGSSSYLQSDDSFDIPAPFTIMSWVYFNNLNQPSGDYDYVFSISNGGSNLDNYAIARWAGGNTHADRLYIYIDGTVRYGPVLPGQEWVHVALAVDPTSPHLRMYVNGEEVALNSYPSSISNAKGKLYLGRFQNPSYPHYLNGKLDEVAVFNRSLSAAEIKSIYERQVSKFKVSARACSDSSCSSSSWSFLGEQGPLNLSSISTSRYFQVMFNFSSFNSSFTPRLFNFTIDHNAVGSGGSGSGSGSSDDGGATTKKDLDLSASFDCDSGLVVEVTKSSGSPLKDARVILRNLDTSSSTSKKTDSDGIVEFTSLQEAEYRITAKKSGYESESTTVSISSCEDESSFSQQEGSQDEPELNGSLESEDAPKEPSLVERLYERMGELQQRISNLTEENRNLKKENELLRKHIHNLNSSVLSAREESPIVVQQQPKRDLFDVIYLLVLATASLVAFLSGVFTGYEVKEFLLKKKEQLKRHITKHKRRVRMQYKHRK